MDKKWLSPGMYFVDRFVHLLLLAVAVAGIGTIVGCAIEESSERVGTGRAEEIDRQSQAVTADEANVVTTSTVSTTTTSTDVGTLPGSLTVGSSGAASYSIPLWLPEGRNGMGPRLTLSYSSAASENHAGYGWALSGAESSIHRCPSDSRRFERPKALAFTSFEADDICLDGAPLVLVSGVHGALGAKYRTEPDSFAEISIVEAEATGPKRFEVRTRDGLIHEFGSSTDASLWVQGPQAAWVAPMGDRNDSSVKNDLTQRQIVRYAWLRGKTTDRFDNAIVYRFGHVAEATAELGFQEYKVTSIEYAFVGTQPTRVVSLNYDLRTDAGSIRDRHVAGMRFRIGKLLRSIEAKVIPSGGTAFTSARYYELAHITSPSTRHALLQQVKECDGNPATAGRTVVCRRPTVFTYDAGSDGFQDIATGIKDLRNASDADYWTLETVDLNNDGKDDIIYRARPPGVTTGPLHWYFRLSTGTGFGGAVDMKIAENETKGDAVVFDGNADGRIDIGVPVTDNSYQFYSNAPVSGIPGFSSLTTINTDTGTKGIMVGDFGGRGQTLFLRPLAVSKEWGYAVFSPTGAPSAISGPLGCNWESRYPLIGWSGQPIDVDSDGAMDALVLPEGGVTAQANRLRVMTLKKGVADAPAQGQDKSGDWDYEDSTLLATNTNDLVKYIVFDHNGDGLPDALRLRQGAATPTLIVNSGNGFAPPLSMSGFTNSAWNVALGSGTKANDVNDPGIRILDFDGDGRQDILFVDNGVVRDSTVSSSPTRSTLQLLLSRGEGKFEAKSLSIPIGLPADGAFKPDAGHIHNYRQSQLLDANGDGLMDIVQVAASDQALHLYLRQGNRRETLVAVKDGMGKRSSLAHAPMIDRTVYTPGTTCSAPQKCVQRGPWVVKSQKTDNGIGGGQNEIKYAYRDARVDLKGAGYLGFAEWTRTDVASSTTVTETFNLTVTADVPMRSDPAKRIGVYTEVGAPATRTIETRDPGFTRVSTTTMGYEFVKTNAERSYYVRPKSARTIERETRSGVTKQLRDETHTFTYDPTHNDFGILSGLSTSSVTTLGTFVNGWTATYQNDPNQWLLGVPLSRTETSRLPSGEQTTRFTQFAPEPGKGVTKIIDVEPVGDADTFLRIEYVRNAFGQVTQVKRQDRAGIIRTESVGYDAQSVHPASYTNPIGHLTKVDADAVFGTPRVVTDPNNAIMTYGYDFFGQLRRVDYPGGFGQTISFARELEPGSLAADERFVTKVSTTYDGGGETRVLINRLGQVIRKESKNLDASFSFASYGYNDLGLLARLTRPAKVGSAEGAATSWSFDELGRPVSRARPEDGLNSAGTVVSSATARMSYDALVATITDDFGRTRRLTSDEFGRPVKSEAKNDAGHFVPVDYTYGTFDVVRFISRKDGVGTQSQTSEARYDVLGRRTFLSDHDTGARTFKYNAFGEVREEVDATGAVTTYTRDLLGRVTQKVDKDGTTTITWDSATNGKGQLAETLSPSGVKRQFFYDTAVRLTRESWTIRGVAYQIDYSYESEGRLAKVSYPNATGFSRLVVANIYNGNSGELAKVQNDATAKAFWELKATDVDGQIKQEAFGNNVLTDYGYSAKTGRVGTIRTTLPGTTTTTLRSWGYGYWMDGNLQRRSDLQTSQHERFEYDGLDRIKRWMAADGSGNPLSGGWTVNYTLDDFGNLTRRQFVAGTSTGGTSQDLSFTLFAGTNRVKTSPWGSYGYDANGNQIARPDSEGVTYTAFDLPKTITGPRAATFLYDAFGTRAEKKKSDTDFTVYVGGIYEKRRSSAGTDHVFYVMAAGRPVAQVNRREAGAETTMYLHADRLGSVDAVSDSAGKVIERTKLDPFGNRVTNFNQPVLPTTIAGASNKVRLGFTGQEHDDELGMINMRGRMYDPRLGRFLTTDPLVSRPFLGQAYNRYSYVLNNPLRFTDPTGFAADQGCDEEEPHKWSDGNCRRNPEPKEVCVVQGNGAVVCTYQTDPPPTPTPTPAIPQPSSNPPPGQPDSGTQGPAGPGPQMTPPTSPTPPSSTDGNGQSTTAAPKPEGKPAAVAGRTAVVTRPVAMHPAVMAILLIPTLNEIAKKVAEEFWKSQGKYVPTTFEALESRRYSPKARDEGFEGSRDSKGTPRCEYCSTEITREPGKDNTYEADHRDPWVQGGETTPENLAPACRSCNRSKGGKTPEQWGGPKPNEPTPEGPK